MGLQRPRYQDRGHIGIERDDNLDQLETKPLLREGGVRYLILSGLSTEVTHDEK